MITFEDKYMPRPSDMIALPFMAIAKAGEHISEDLLDGPMRALDDNPSLLGCLAIGIPYKIAEIVGCAAIIPAASLKFTSAWVENIIFGKRDCETNYFEDLYADFFS